MGNGPGSLLKIILASKHYSHIILRIKRDENGNSIRFKARIMVGGHLQRPGIDHSVYSLVVDFALVRSVMAIVLHNGWYTKHVDVRTAVLSGDVARDTRVMHPANLTKYMPSLSTAKGAI